MHRRRAYRNKSALSVTVDVQSYGVTIVWTTVRVCRMCRFALNSAQKRLAVGLRQDPLGSLQRSQTL